VAALLFKIREKNNIFVLGLNLFDIYYPRYFFPMDDILTCRFLFIVTKKGTSRICSYGWQLLSLLWHIYSTQKVSSGFALWLYCDVPYM